MGLFRLLLLFLVLSGLVHVFAIAATPYFAEGKAIQRVKALAPARTLVPLADHEEAVSLLKNSDPAMAYAICHFNLKNGTVNVTSDGPTDFWNVTIYNDQAETIYSLHDDVSQSNQLDLEINLRTDISPSTPSIQNENDGQADPTDDSKIRIRLNEGDLFLVFKVFKESRHHAAIIKETFEAAECR